MKIAKKIWALAAGMVLATLPLAAQIETGGTDPGRTRWSEIQGGNFRMIYPRGMDSLATSYYNELQRFRMPLARSIGFAPGDLQFGKTPIILHPFTVASNGSVTWAPRRMELYTMPDPYESLPQPWMTQLAVHEGRHLAQMQFGYKGILKYPWYVLGEMWTGALCGLYPNSALMEGDAVVAETALTRSGRGRSADFLGYYPVAFDNGDWRDWYQWRYGSYKRFAPDHYTSGYMIVAGTRYFFNDATFTRRYFKSVNEKPWKLFHFQRTVREASGRKFRESWQKIMQSWRDIWQEEALKRAPFDEWEQVSKTPEFPADYSPEVFADGNLYLTRDGLDHARQLIIRSKDGTEKILRPFAGATSPMNFDPEHHRLYWTESIGDARWELAGKSIVRYLSTTDHKPHDLTSEGRLFNPCPSPEGDYLSCTEYLSDGKHRIRVIRTTDGSTAWTIPAPGNNEQLCETAWTEDTIYATAISDGGYTLWAHPADGSGSWRALAGPLNATMLYLDADGNDIEFVSDRSGVNELYTFNAETGKTLQLTSSRYGSTDFALDEDSDSLYFTSQTPQGMMVFRTAARDLRPKEVDLCKVHAWRVADKLAQQEDSLAVFYPESEPAAPSAPKDYNKLTHLIKFHSWAPIYFNYDNVSSMSMDFSYETASLGLTGLFQNELGTAYGSIGYSAHKNPQDRSRWKNSLHGQFTYAGWYPVIEARFDFNDRNAQLYRHNQITNGGEEYISFSGSIRKAPAFHGSLSVYVPLKFNKSGWLNGVIPKVSYAVSNDILNTTRRDLTLLPMAPGGTIPVFTGSTDGKEIPMQKLVLSARGYRMRPTADSNVYPSLGVGGELGYSFRPGLTGIFTPDIYAYVYGYAPGFAPTQGFRFSAIVQQMLHTKGHIGDNQVLTLPRGFDSSLAGALSDSPTQARLTVDYAIPIWIGDISVMSPVIYIKNLLVKPHADLTFAKGTLFSTGFDFTVELCNFIWFPFDCSVGFSLDVNGGSRFKALKAANDGIHRVSAGFIFSMDI